MRKIDEKRLIKFGYHLRKIREAKGLSLRQLAQACDVDFSKIGKLENNNTNDPKVNVTLTTLIEIAAGLEVELTELLDFDFE